MKTMTRSLLFIALAAATGSAAAQDAHAGHHGHDAATTPDPHADHAAHGDHASPATPSASSDPHAGHASASPTGAAKADPHAGHAVHVATAASDGPVANPHAGHSAPPSTSGADMHADHAAHEDHASHAMPPPSTDPHAGHATHAATATSTGPVADPHAGHEAPVSMSVQSDTHADHAAHGNHASPAMPSPSTDPHAGHAMEAPASTSRDLHEAHVGHGMHDGHARQPAPAATSAHAGHAPATPAVPSNAGEHGEHGRHDAAAPQAPREPIPEPTTADLAAAFPTLQPHAMQHAPGFNSLVVFDHLEAWNNAHGSGQSWAAKGWFGGDIDRLWLRSEGQRSEGRLGEWSLDALHGHAISPWWDVVAGVRHDGGDVPGLTRAALGVQGLAPYKFEFAATAYLGGPRRAELAMEAEYSLLLTNRLILQPTLEAGLAADDDPRRGVGRGLGHVEAGLRLRYEITRRFAPYVGFVHERRYGRTAELHRDAGESPRDSRWVAGVRFWF